jgi:3-dehydroquinate dehydratase
MREQSGESTADLLEVAVDLLERDRFLDSANAAYAALRDQPEAWAQEQEERAAWEVTLSDDLQPEQ